MITNPALYHPTKIANLMLKAHVNSIIDVGVQIYQLSAHQFALSFEVNGTKLADFVKAKCTDFLWEATCFECFFGFDDGSYIEINAAPAGDFACYYFDKYRTPSQLPPKKADGVIFHWADKPNNHARHFMVTLPKTAQLIHPAAIIVDNNTSLHNTPLYFAVQHATPPDFHNQSYWKQLTTLS